MKTVDLNFELKNLENGPMGNAGQFLAAVLMAENKGDAIKFFDWAMALQRKETISVDTSDLLKIKDVINNTPHATVLAKAQILRYLETVS